MSVILAMILGTVGVATGLYASSKKRMSTHEGKSDKMLWSLFLTLFTVGIVAGVFIYPEAGALSFGAFSAMLANKGRKLFDPRIRRFLVARTHGVARAVFLGETKEEKQRRREVMPLARQRRRKVFRILERSHVDGASVLRTQINQIINTELPELFARRPQIRKALARAEAILERDRKFPSRRLSDQVREKTRADRDYFQEELDDIDEAIRMYLRLLDHLSSNADYLHLTDNDVDPKRVRDWSEGLISEVDRMVEVQEELRELDENGTATTSISTRVGATSGERDAARARQRAQRAANGE